MKLFWIEINGYKKFSSKSKLNVQSKVIALVGPNEAGKTSLISAINHIDMNKQMIFDGPNRELTREKSFSRDQIIITAGYLLEKSDRDKISHIKGGKYTNWYMKSKKANGKFLYNTSPPIKREYKYRQQVIKSIDKAIKNESFVVTLEESESEIGPVTFEDLQNKLGSDSYSLDQTILQNLKRHSDVLKKVDTKSFPKYIQNLSKELSELYKYESQDPYDQVLNILDSQCPFILNFTEDDRDLKLEYNLEEAAYPKALMNLSSLAELDLNQLHESIKRNDPGKVETLIQAANLKLKEAFENSWSQSDVHVHFKLDGYLLQILVRNEDLSFNSIAERSDGLRWFASLLSFLTLQETKSKKSIILIDEAETHLHYDAQADLVQMFAKQNVAEKVIYTTHSVGCLPEDLGSGVRLIEPISENSSMINNWFWSTDEPGFSPLLFGMGARTLAFIPVRYAIFTEGAADIILLPTLFREAIDKDFLGFQIAPGLSSATQDQVAYIQRDASRIAFLVDSNGGGKIIETKLKRSGVPENLILKLPKYNGKGMVTEDFVDPHVFCTAVNRILQRIGSTADYKINDVSDTNRPRSLKTWCKKNCIKPPEKGPLAYEILDVANEQGLMFLYKKRKRSLKSLYLKIAAILCLSE